jgi:hypothetical protein
LTDLNLSTSESLHPAFAKISLQDAEVHSRVVSSMQLIDQRSKVTVPTIKLE